MDALLEIGEDGPDLVLEAGDLAVDEGLWTAVALSLFCDARARADDELPEAGADPRGWPLEAVGDRWGSRLWLLERAKATADSAALARGAALDALAWLAEDDVAESVDVEAELSGSGLGLVVTIARGAARRWSELWAGLERGETSRGLAGASLRLLVR